MQKFNLPTARGQTTDPIKKRPEIIILSDEDHFDSKTDQKSDLSLNSTSLRGVMAVPSIGKASLPPMWKAETFHSKMQYTNSTSALSSLSITRGGMAASAGAFAYASAVNARTLASSFRLKSIRMWPGIGGSGGPAQETNLQWVGSSGEGALGKDEPRERLIPGGVTIDGVATFVPPKESFHSFWQFSNVDSTQVFCQIQNLNVGSVVEVNLEFTLPSHQNPGYSFSIGTTTAGTFGYPALDLPTTNQLRPLAAVNLIY